MNELISIIIPYKEDRGFLEEAGRSCLEQRYPFIEIIHSNKNYNTAHNMNCGLLRASGEYITFLAEDDILPVGAAYKLVKACTGYDWACSNARFIGGKTSTYKSKVPKSAIELFNKNTIHSGTCVYRRDTIINLGCFDSRLDVAEDLDLHCRLLMKGLIPNYVDEVTYCQRIWSKQLTKAQIDRSVYRNIIAKKLKITN